MLWLAHHNPEIDQRTGEVKMMRCPEECGKQWRPKQGKTGQQKRRTNQKGQDNRSEEGGREVENLG